jgi:hypothetical protein
VKAHLEATNPARAAAASFVNPDEPAAGGEREPLSPEEERRELLGLRTKRAPRIGVS